MYDKLLTTAKHALETINETIDELPLPQVTVLLSESSQLYVAVNDITGTICDTLKNHNDTEIVAMLTMWKDGCVDVASFPFRKALIKTDERNRQTDVVLLGDNGYYITKKLAVLVL